MRLMQTDIPLVDRADEFPIGPSGKPQNWRKNPILTDHDLQLSREHVGQEDLDLLVNLWWTAKMMLGHDQSFNIRQIHTVIESDPTYERARTVIDHVRVDALHGGSFDREPRTQKLRLRRITPAAKGLEPKPKGEDRSELFRSDAYERTKWGLILATGENGGGYFWPSRGLVAHPEAGSLIRWPYSWPWGMVPMTGADPTFLLTGESTSEEGQQGEPWPDMDEVLRSYKWSAR